MVATSAVSSFLFDSNGNNGNNKQRGGTDDLPEEVVIDIIARLPPKSVVSFKLVCKQYKSLTESAFFRDIYRRNFYAASSSNCSILHGGHHLLLEHSSLELLKLDLPSPSSLGDSFFASVLAQEEIRVAACADGLVLLRLNEKDMKKTRYYIGNPVLPQWIQLPPPPSTQDLTFLFPGFSVTGLVTRMHNGSLLAYKVVRLHIEALKWSFEIFSSDTGEWSVTQVSCPVHYGVSMFGIFNPVSLNGKLHWLDHSRRIIIVHDFFEAHHHDEDQLRVISLPASMQGIEPRRFGMYFSPTPSAKMICTTSQGYFVLVDAGLLQEVKSSYNVRVWRLKCDVDSWNWQKAWEINMASVGLPLNCVPMAVNCFDIHIIYLWDLDLKCFLSFNLLANTISYVTRKDGVYTGNNPFVFHDPMAVDGVVYKEDKLCFEQHPCLFHFVPSLQVVPS
ncbi:putative F-box protein At3g23950 [Raphanus sativus]|uniref:F-box protein At3g23950 n=1 Tax=Raphanus sativus TaxID=3726 RepID=A0A6J0MED0_RAPSA|nr:putative F-box protein At3g23950 [Raphanus sativus]